MNIKVKLEEGKYYKGENDIKYFTIQVRNNISLLKSNDEYVIANGTKIEENTKKISWDYGSYFRNLTSASLKFNELTLSDNEKIKRLIQSFNQVNKFTLISSIIEYFQDNDKYEITENDLKKLEYIYDRYISDEFNLLSEETRNLEEEYNFDKIKKNIVDYFKEMNVDMNKFTDKKISDMAEDVLDYSLESNDTPSSLIWAVDYFAGEVEELNSKEECEEEDYSEI